MAEVHGTCDPRFETVKTAFADNFDQGLDVGASAAVVLDGELVADVWGGTSTRPSTTRGQRDTIINVYSTTKTMTSLSALMLADRGELDVDGKVVRYWPEFAAAGKAGSSSAISSATPPGCRAGKSPWSSRISTIGKTAPRGSPRRRRGGNRARRRVITR